MVVGQLEPDSGHLRRGHTASKFKRELTYFDQNRNELDRTKTLWETLCPGGGDHIKLADRTRHVCGYLKDFMFDPKDARNSVATLSGGQANRLMLAKILANPGSVLVLDEPTNDLDMDTLDMLQEILFDYKGTLLLVSHDRDFIDRIVTKTIVFEGDGEVVECVGGYSDYLAEKQRVAGKSNKKKETESAPQKEKEKRGTTKLSFKHKHALETLPKTNMQSNLIIS